MQQTERSVATAAARHRVLTIKDDEWARQTAAQLPNVAIEPLDALNDVRALEVSARAICVRYVALNCGARLCIKKKKVHVCDAHNCTSHKCLENARGTCALGALGYTSHWLTTDVD